MRELLALRGIPLRLRLFHRLPCCALPTQPQAVLRKSSGPIHPAWRMLFSSARNTSDRNQPFLAAGTDKRISHSDDEHLISFVPLSNRCLTTDSSPHRTGGRHRGRRNHFCRNLKGLSNKAAWSPVRHGDQPVRPAHAKQFGRNFFGTRSKHRAKHAEHDIKAGVRKRQILGVALFEANLEILCCRTLSCLLQKLVAMSTPVTCAPTLAAGIAVFPVPHATSSNFAPGRIPSRFTKFSASSAVKLAIWPKSPAIHVAFMRDFNFSEIGDGIHAYLVCLDAPSRRTVRLPPQVAPLQRHTLLKSSREGFDLAKNGSGSPGRRQTGGQEPHRKRCLGCYEGNSAFFRSCDTSVVAGSHWSRFFDACAQFWQRHR